jgi:hypothetical protein
VSKPLLSDGHGTRGQGVELDSEETGSQGNWNGCGIVVVSDDLAG